MGGTRRNGTHPRADAAEADGGEATPPSAPAPFRVWILNHYASPPDRGGSTRHFMLGRELVRRGADVTVFATGFGHSSGQDTRLRRGQLARTEHHDGLRFVWVRTFPYRGNTWRRIVNMLSYGPVVLVAQAGRPAPDVVIGSTVHPIAAFTGWLVARLRGARFIYEVRDLWPQTFVDIGAMGRRNPGVLALGLLESFLVRQAESVVTVLPGMRAYLEAKGLPTDHVRYLPNGADVASYDRTVVDGRGPADPLAPLLADLGASRAAGQTTFAWLGSHGRVNGLDVVVRAAALLAEERAPVRVLFAGDGPEKPSLCKLAATLDARNVTFVDPVPKERVPELLAAVDVGLVHSSRTPVHRYGVSFNKLFDYMAARKPILFACDAANDPVALAGAGLSITPDDPVALAAAMRTMAAMDAEERARMGEAGRAFAEREHDARRLGARLAGIVGMEGAA